MKELIEELQNIQSEIELLEDNGYKFDNHICFTTNNGLAFMYSSRCLYIGTKVIKRNW